MALSTAERLIVDGVDIRTLAKYLPKGASGATLAVPGRRGENVATVARHGSLWTPSKAFDEGQFTIPLLVRGTDDDGRVPSGSSPRRELYRRIDELVTLFSKAHALLTVQRVLPDGSTREIAAECTSAMDWEVPGAGVMARVDFTMTAPDPFWRAAAGFSTAMAAATPTTVAAGATAPLDDGTFLITGPITNPRITDVVTGAWVQYGAAISATQTLTVNAATWQLTSTGSLSTAMSLVSFSGTGGRLMRLAPDPVSRGYRAQLTGTQTSTATRLTISGRAKYLTG